MTAAVAQPGSIPGGLPIGLQSDQDVCLKENVHFPANHENLCATENIRDL